MPPLVIWKAARDGTVTDEHVDHYARSAGPGLVIVEATTIEPAGRLAATQLGAWSDDHVPGLSSLAGAIKEAGGRAGIQIHHAGGNTRLEKTYGESPRAPSLWPGVCDGAVELSGEEIDALVAKFAAAVSRALDAGFEVIELHGAHGYLISQFLSPVTNTREDRWGGTPENRRRFMVEVVGAARSAIEQSGRAESTALTIRLGVAAGGRRSLALDEGLAAAEACVAAGVDFLDVSNAGGMDEDTEAEIRHRAADAIEPPAAAEDASPTMLLAALVRRRVSVPVVGVGGVKTAKQAAALLDGGVADLVAVGRGILADPRWAKKSLGEDPEPLSVCVDCKPRCFWFNEPAKCPARKLLARRGEQPPVA